MKQMNKLLLIPVLFFLMGATAFAQNIELESDSLYLETENLDEFEYVLYSHIRSAINQNQDYYWEKSRIDCPEDWQVSMCIGDQCYLHFVDDHEEDLSAGEREEYSLHLANTQGESGLCNWETKFVTLGAEDTTYVSNIWVLGPTSLGEELAKVQFSFYPNPVKDVLNLNVGLPVELVIGNALGQTAFITDVPLGRSDVNLSGLTKGLYTISFNYKGKNLYTRQFVKR